MTTVEFSQKKISSFLNSDRKTIKGLEKENLRSDVEGKISNNDFPALCKTSFVFHYKGVSTFDVFDNYTEISNNVEEWKRQRELRGG